MKPTALALLSASPALLTAVFIAKLWATGTLGYNVNQRTAWIVLLGGIFFAAVGIASLRHAFQHPHDRPGWRTWVFLLPVLAGLLIPPRPLSASSGQASSLGALQLASHVSSTPGDDFGSWISALAQHPDANWWSGQQVTLVGFVAHQTGLPPRSVIVGRYLVTCCVVDATLLGFPVQLARGPLPATGSWVQVHGVFGSQSWTDPSGAHYPIVLHAHLSPVTVPSSPYLSP